MLEWKFLVKAYETYDHSSCLQIGTLAVGKRKIGSQMTGQHAGCRLQDLE